MSKLVQILINLVLDDKREKSFLQSWLLQFSRSVTLHFSAVKISCSLSLSLKPVMLDAEISRFLTNE